MKSNKIKMKSSFTNDIEKVYKGDSKNGLLNDPIKLVKTYNQIVSQNSSLQKALVSSSEIPIYRKELAKYKSSLVLTELQKDIICGTLLGDSGLRIVSGKGMLLFEQRNVAYLLHLYEKMSSLVRNPPKLRFQQRGAQIRGTYYFSTITSEQLAQYYGWFYPEGKKCLPININEVLTERALAYWFMDDGSITFPGYHINSQSFLLEEHNALVMTFREKFGLNATIHKSGGKEVFNQFRLYIPANEVKTFNRLVAPYMVESMMYKLIEMSGP